MLGRRGFSASPRFHLWFPLRILLLLVLPLPPVVQQVSRTFLRGISPCGRSSGPLIVSIPEPHQAPTGGGRAVDEVYAFYRIGRFEFDCPGSRATDLPARNCCTRPSLHGEPGRAEAVEGRMVRAPAGDQGNVLSIGWGLLGSCLRSASGREELRVLGASLYEADLWASAATAAPKPCHHSVHRYFCGFSQRGRLDGAAHGGFRTTSVLPQRENFVLLSSPLPGDPATNLQVLDLPSFLPPGVRHEIFGGHPAQHERLAG